MNIPSLPPIAHAGSAHPGPGRPGAPAPEDPKPRESFRAGAEGQPGPGGAGGEPRLFAEFESLTRRVPEVLDRHRVELTKLEQQYRVDGAPPPRGSELAREYGQARSELLRTQGHEMLLLQSDMQRAHFGVELLAKVVEQATSGVRTLSQTQI